MTTRIQRDVLRKLKRLEGPFQCAVNPNVHQFQNAHQYYEITGAFGRIKVGFASSPTNHDNALRSVMRDTRKRLHKVIERYQKTGKRTGEKHGREN